MDLKSVDEPLTTTRSVEITISNRERMAAWSIRGTRPRTSPVE
jgi:hypothetical protein